MKFGAFKIANNEKRDLVQNNETVDLAKKGKYYTSDLNVLIFFL